MDEWAFETNLFVVIQIFDSNNLLWRDYYMIRGGLEEDSKIFMQQKKHLFRPETLGELNFDSHEIVWPIEDRLQEKKTCHLAELYKQHSTKQQPAHAAKRCRSNFFINWKRALFIST